LIDSRLVAVAALAVAAAAVVTAYVIGHPINSTDVAVERDVQSVPWGPLVIVFTIFSFIGDAKGAVIEALIFIAVLVFNRRAWPFAALASLAAGWYLLLNHFIDRPRPTTPLVLHVTEHPGASSFPSGHTMFIVTVVTVLMLCLGYRFLRGWSLAAGWLIAGVLVILNGAGRVDSGAHWPSDVLAAFLFTVAWLSLVLAPRAINRRIARE
jgi:undecaprenyl-diphosphatase